ncbi:MAG: hypothetical protein R3C03_03405 [Pirellulaceae bacterium]
MSESESDFSPWSHASANKWLGMIFSRSELIDEFERWASRDTEHLSEYQLRLLTSLLVILGHPSIWPEEEQARLSKLAMRAHSLVRNYREEKRSAQSVAEHQFRQQVQQDLDVEAELLRRRANISKRTNKLTLPKSWYRFWN